jgi:hypothetical protein
LHGFSGADRGGGVFYFWPSVARVPPRPLNGITLSGPVVRACAAHLNRHRHPAALYVPVSARLDIGTASAISTAGVSPFLQKFHYI